MIRGVALALLSGILSAFSQVLLKKSASVKRDSVIREYLNPMVLSGYALTFCCIILMIFAYRELPLKYGAVFESLVYIYAVILGKLFFGEEITTRKIMGNLFIIAGVIVFSIA